MPLGAKQPCEGWRSSKPNSHSLEANLLALTQHSSLRSTVGSLTWPWPQVVPPGDLRWECSHVQALGKRGVRLGLPHHHGGTLLASAHCSSVHAPPTPVSAFPCGPPRACCRLGPLSLQGQGCFLSGLLHPGGSNRSFLWAGTLCSSSCALSCCCPCVCGPGSVCPGQKLAIWLVPELGSDRCPDGTGFSAAFREPAFWRLLKTKDCFPTPSLQGPGGLPSQCYR